MSMSGSLTSRAQAQAVPRWYAIAIGALFGLFYANAVWQAIDGLVGAASGPLGLNAMGWIVWLMAALVPWVAFAIAAAVGRTRGMLTYPLALLAGLGLVAVFWLNVLAYATLNAPALVG